MCLKSLKESYNDDVFSYICNALVVFCVPRLRGRTGLARKQIGDTRVGEDALEWRLDRGAGSCEEYMPAIDAWTLEWIAESDEIRVEIDTEEWPVFTSEPLLQGTLIQIMALEQLKGLDYDNGRILRKLKRVARRSEGGISDELKLVFNENKNLQED